MNLCRALMIFTVAITFSHRVVAHPCSDFTTPANAELEYPSLSGTPNSAWIYQEFKHNGEPARDSVSAWKIRVSERGVSRSKFTLAIEEAFFITSEGVEVKVLTQLWPAQIWVPYEQKNEVPLDLFWGAQLTPIITSGYGWECSEPGPALVPPGGGASRAVFMKELRDTGISEMRLQPGLTDIWRRGEELVLWANSDAGNYDNYIAYHFRDDGQVVATVGTSGWNTTNHNYASTSWVPHIHTVLWHVQPKVGDWQENDKVYRVEILQNPVPFDRTEKVRRTHIVEETAFPDIEEHYTSVLFETEETNSLGEKMGYVVSRMSEGNARHRVSETINGVSIVPNNFFILKKHANETNLQLINTALINSSTQTNIVSQDDNESIADGGAVLYAVTSVKHIPRSEDFLYPPHRTYPVPATQSGHYNNVFSNNAHNNRTRIVWHGLVMTPRNIHRNVPFGRNKPNDDVEVCCDQAEFSILTDPEDGVPLIWTAWLNRDRPSGKGDFETLEQHIEESKVCKQPADIQCRASDGGTWVGSGQSYTCRVDRGGICTNAEQLSGRCKDYEVRFLCPK